MRLLSARTRMFRNIVDSRDVAFEKDVTCLVGKNESGKTAMLSALYRMNPASTGVGLDVLTGQVG